MLQSAWSWVLMRVMPRCAAPARLAVPLRVRDGRRVEAYTHRGLRLAIRTSNVPVRANDALVRGWLRTSLLQFSCALAAASAHAEAPTDPSQCIREAQKISGYHAQERKSALGSAVKGGLGGAAVGAAGGWVTGGDSGKAAKRGAALGAVIGTVKAASENKDLDRKRETYERALQACQARQQSKQP
jgi:hypothetical protein